MKEVGNKIDAIDAELRETEETLHALLLRIPNMTDKSVPVGKDDSENPEVRRWGEIPKFDFPIKAHYELGEELGILDSERAGKVAGARFYFYLGAAARLERAIYNLMLDMHTQENDYTEVIPPYIINGASMTGTGQLPKFAEDMYKVEGEDMYMTPTAEVPLTNYFAGEILDGKDLPVHVTAFTPCFRKEAGSAGKDTRGLIRQHQFHKVEMVKYCKPEDSWDELESLTAEAERVLQRLGLPIMWSASARAISASPRPRPTIWKCGCRPRTNTEKFPPAPTALTSRHGAPISASAVTRETSRNSFIP